MFADIRRLMALYDDVPDPEDFAEHHEPKYTENITYGWVRGGMVRCECVGVRVGRNCSIRAGPRREGERASMGLDSGRGEIESRAMPAFAARPRGKGC